MKYLDEYRDPVAAAKLRQALLAITTRPWTIMEVCGGQTHTIVKYGIDELLPPGIELVHGPGCPVCVTPLELIDKAIAIASRPEVIFCSFGDMLRVPGSRRDLFAVKAAGGDVRIVYSPLDCLQIAEQNPARTVVFFAVGFETTAPPNAMAVWQAKRRGLKNFAVLVSHVLVPPAMTAILASPANRVQGFLGAGHVCTVMGYEEYEPLGRAISASRSSSPALSRLICWRASTVASACSRRGGTAWRISIREPCTAKRTRRALRLIRDVFEVTDRKWRGIGTIPQSGFRLSPAYADFDAERRFAVEGVQVAESSVCISGLILQGLKKPHDCPAFGKTCTPENPLGATMVSSEGACAAYYHYGRFRHPAPAATVQLETANV